MSDEYLILIPGNTTSTGWGVVLSDEDIFAATPCHSAPLYWDRDEGPYTCHECATAFEAPAELPYLNLAGGMNLHLVDELVSEWTGCTEAGQSVLGQIFSIASGGSVGSETISMSLSEYVDELNRDDRWATAQRMLVPNSTTTTGWGIATSAGDLYPTTPCCNRRAQEVEVGHECEGCGRTVVLPGGDSGFQIVIGGTYCPDADRMNRALAAWTGSLPGHRIIQIGPY